MILTFIFFLLMLVFLNGLGNYVINKFDLKSTKRPEFLGFVFFSSIFFLVNIIFTVIKTSSSLATMFFLVTILVLLVLSFRHITIHKEPKSFVLGVILSLVFCLLSSRYTLSFLYSDTSFYMNMVGGNLSNEILHSINPGNGYVLDEILMIRGYIYQSFFLMHSLVAKLILVGNRIIGSEVSHFIPIYTYGSTFLYTFLSYSLVDFVITRYAKIRLAKLVAFIFCILYMGNLYWNIAFAFYGNTFRNLILAVILLTYFENKDRANIMKLITLMIFGLYSTSSSGLFMSIAIAMGIIAQRVFEKRTHVISESMMMLVPIALYGGLNQEITIMVIAALVLVPLSIAVRKFEEKHDLVIEYNQVFKILVMSLPVIFMLGSLVVVKFNIGEYISSIGSYFASHSHYDMVPDYFRFIGDDFLESIVQTLSIIVYWISFLILISNKKYRIFMVVVMLTFLSPFTVPFVEKFFTRYVFYRNFFVVFNLYFIALGLTVFMNRIRKAVKPSLIVAVIILLMGVYEVNNFYNYDQLKANLENTNILYRTTSDEVEVLLNLKHFIAENDDKNPKVLSQSYATNSYVPNAFIMYGTYIDRSLALRGKEYSNELHKMYKFPRFPGDPYINSGTDYDNAEELIKAANIKYIILQLDLAYQNSLGDWIPLHHSVSEFCNELYRNETYIMFEVIY